MSYFTATLFFLFPLLFPLWGKEFFTEHGFRILEENARICNAFTH